MKISLVFILFILFISCNQNQPPVKQFNGLEDDPQDTADSQQNKTGTNKTANAFKDSKALLNVNKGIVGAYLGTNDGKYFKMCLEKIWGDNAEGYVVTGNDKTIVKGKIMKLAVEPAQLGGATTYRLILSETNPAKLKGEYVITLSVSPKSTSGEGNWISKNKRLSTEIVIKERAI